MLLAGGTCCFLLCAAGLFLPLCSGQEEHSTAAQVHGLCPWPGGVRRCVQRGLTTSALPEGISG